MDEISSTLENISLSAHNDRDTVVQITESNKNLTGSNKIVTEKINTDINSCATITKIIKELTKLAQELNKKFEKVTPFKLSFP